MWLTITKSSINVIIVYVTESMYDRTLSTHLNILSKKGRKLCDGIVKYEQISKTFLKSFWPWFLTLCVYLSARGKGTWRLDRQQKTFISE